MSPRQYSTFNAIAQRRATERVFPFGIKQHVRAGLERDGYRVQDGTHDSLIAFPFLADVDRQLARSPLVLRASVWRRIAQWWCGVKGHNHMLHFEGQRMMLRCATCQHDTPGWTVAK